MAHGLAGCHKNRQNESPREFLCAESPRGSLGPGDMSQHDHVLLLYRFVAHTLYCEVRKL